LSDRTHILNSINQIIGPDIELITLKALKDILVYFLCKSVTALHRLDGLCVTGELNDSMNEILVHLLKCRQQLLVHCVQLQATDYTRYVRYYYERMDLLHEVYRCLPRDFQLKTVDLVNGSVSPTEVLPVGLWNKVLLKAAGILFMILSKLTSRAYIVTLTTLNAVSDVWRKSWDKQLLHQLYRHLQDVCRPYYIKPRLLNEVGPANLRIVHGVAQLDNKLFVLHENKSIYIYGPDHNLLENNKLNELEKPRDMVGCPETGLLYIADYDQSSDQGGNVWQVSIDTHNVTRLPTVSTMRPVALSVMSQRLLVTSVKPNELFLLAADGTQLGHVPLADFQGGDLRHAVETLTGTFIVSSK
jgi:hypothetical protein